MKKLIIIVLIVAAAGVAGWWWWQQGEGVEATAFRTVAVERGDLQASIAATGTLQPQDAIDVGAQVAGRIVSFGADPNQDSGFIDYGSEVKEGQELASIDPSLFETRKAQAAAALLRAQADLGQMEAKLNQTRLEWSRAQELRARRPPAISDTEADLARANFESAEATLGVGKAAVAQAEAALKEAEINLSYTKIRAPANGVIIDRRVNIGQTVVASLNAPSLFLLAKDLRRMQVWASINEADIGDVYEGQPVTFTVDTFRGEKFHGKVTKRRLNANMTQNVVNYTVVVTVDNTHPDDSTRPGKLLPYLTANLQFETGRAKDALLVPNAALRWKPRPETIAPEFREEYAATDAPRRPDGSEPGPAPGAKPSGNDRARRSVVWVVQGEYLKPIPVKTGLTDGSRTVILEGDVTPGSQVAIGEQRTTGSQTVNPFTPQIRRRPQGS